MKIPCTCKIFQIYSERVLRVYLEGQNTSSKGVRRILDALGEVVYSTCVCLPGRVV